MENIKAKYFDSKAMIEMPGIMIKERNRTASAKVKEKKRREAVASRTKWTVKSWIEIAASASWAFSIRIPLQTIRGTPFVCVSFSLIIANATIRSIWFELIERHEIIHCSNGIPEYFPTTADEIDVVYSVSNERLRIIIAVAEDDEEERRRETWNFFMRATPTPAVHDQTRLQFTRGLNRWNQMKARKRKWK